MTTVQHQVTLSDSPSCSCGQDLTDLDRYRARIDETVAKHVRALAKSGHMDSAIVDAFLNELFADLDKQFFSACFAHAKTTKEI